MKVVCTGVETEVSEHTADTLTLYCVAGCNPVSWYDGVPSTVISAPQTVSEANLYWSFQEVSAPPAVQATVAELLVTSAPTLLPTMLPHAARAA